MLSWFLQLLVFEKDREAALLEGKQLYLCQLYYSAKKQGAGHNWKKKKIRDSRSSPRAICDFAPWEKQVRFTRSSGRSK